MLTISRQALQQNIQKYFTHIEETGEDVVVTVNDTPFLKLIPFKSKPKVEDIFRDVQGKVKYHGDILNPETEEWGEL